MRKIILTSFVAMFCKLSFAQNIILHINIKNEKLETVINATTQILRVKDSAVLFTKTASVENNFSLLKNSNYLLKITSVNTITSFLQIQTSSSDTALSIVLYNTTKQLDKIVVNSRTPLVKQEDDKTIIDAEQLASSSTNAFEILEKTPGTVIDQDGNVFLNSATPASIYINGRELKLSVADIASLLKSLPANSISKIEILRTPSAKYDAASSGGIVNVVLKKGIKLGVNGSVDISYFQGVYGTETIGFNVSKNENKLNTYLSYNFTERKNFTILTSNRLNTGITFNQYAFTTLPTVTNYAAAGLDYKINKKVNIAYDARFTANNNRSYLHNDIDIYENSNGTRVGQNISLLSNTGPTFYLGNTISSKYKINARGSEWSNALDYSYFKIDNQQQYQNINLKPVKNTLFGDGDIQNEKHIVVVKSDLVLMTKSKFIIELGTKLNGTRSSNNALYYADTSTGKYLNTLQTNGFKYTENIAAAYFQVSKTFGGFTVKPGVRLEYTDIIGHQLVPTDTLFKIKSTNLFPFIFVRHSLGKLIGFKLTGNLIFRRSITRPFYEVLNPFPRYADQYTYDVGNPALQPQFTNNYEFNISANELPVFSFGLNDIQNIFTTLTYQKNNILYRTYDNLGSNKEIYFRIVAGVPPGKKFFFYAGTQANIINYKGLYNGVPFNYHRASFNVFMFQSLKATPTLTLSLNGFMRINGVANFFETKTYGTLNFTASKTLLKKKMNITFSANDMLRSNIINFNIDVPYFAGNGRNSYDSRRCGIALKYVFGLKPKPEKKQGFEFPIEGAQ